MFNPPPRPESRGCCKASSRQNESMVEMRSCAGRSSSFQSSTHERCNARCARASIENSSSADAGSALAEAFSNSDRMRWRISAAATLVKVMATISAGSLTSASRRKKRRVSRSVLPEPAGACTRMERLGSSARSRSAWSGGAGRVGLLIGCLRIVGVVVGHECKLLNAADGLQPAALAGFGMFARIDLSAAGEEVASELFDCLSPGDELLGGQRIFHQRGTVFQIGKERGSCVADTPGEAKITGADLGEDHAAEQFILDCEAGIERQLNIVGTGKLPCLGRDVAGFVVDHQQRAVVEPVDAIEPQFQREAGNGWRGIHFSGGYGEGQSSQLELQPLADKPREALFFEFEVAARHLLARGGGQLL